MQAATLNWASQRESEITAAVSKKQAALMTELSDADTALETSIVVNERARRAAFVLSDIDIVVHGNIGHMSAFMAQSGNLVVLGDAGEALGDSLYEARLFVRGSVKSLGTDCIEKEMRPEHYEILADLLKRGEADGKAKPQEFKRYGSARKLYNFNIDNASSY